ncbi:MAG: ABC transporter substrate-binding protein, partial [Desulfobacterales bacterium]|nr:ABC transporter substrate-binding protein [Desulfobacterales bacterium]
KIASPRGESIHIAFGGPMSGDGAAAGKLMTRAIQSYLDRVNDNGGVHGKRLVLDVFDDRNDAVQAKRNALKMARENRVLAVIGHWYSSCSISAGGVYEQFGIPALTPGAIRDEVTLNNPWYFRTIYNINTLGMLLPKYIKNVLQYDGMSIIHEDGNYSHLAELVRRNAPDSNLVVKNNWMFEARSPDLDTNLQRIVDELKTRKDPGVIFLAAQAPEGAKLVKILKEAGIRSTIIGPSSFAEKTFLHGLRDFPEEQKNPGHYTNGIYIVAPLIFDTANREAQDIRQKYMERWKEEPDWSVAFAHDSAKIIVQAIRESGARGDPGAIREERRKIRAHLAGVDTPAEAIEGAAGFTYFDQKGDARRMICVGAYRNNNIISALGQLRPVRYRQEIPNLAEALEKKRVLEIDGQLTYRTNVVYAGVEMNKISDLDLENPSCSLDFYLWLRHQGEIDATNIEFLNTASPVQWIWPDGAAVKESVEPPPGEGETDERGTVTFIKKEEGKDGITSHLFRVKARFRYDFYSNRWGAGELHTLGFGFRHRNLGQNNLIYVTDIMGLGLGGDLSLEERMKNAAVLNPESGWLVDKAWFFQDVVKKSTMGDLNYLDLEDKLVEHSRFNFRARIKKNTLSFRRKISRGRAGVVAVVSCLALALLFLGRIHERLCRRPRVVWAARAASAALLLLSAEAAILYAIPDSAIARGPRVVILMFNVLWWLAPAFLATLALETFFWLPIQNRIQRPVPNVLRRFVVYIIYFIAVYGIIVFAFGLNINKLMATSGMVAMIIGFVAKSNISDFFAGVMINDGDAIRIGDWVKIGGHGEGKIMDVTWQFTGLDPGDGSHLSIPNSDVLGSGVNTYHLQCRLRLKVEVDPAIPYKRVEKILMDAALSMENILAEPAPAVRFQGQGDESCVYFLEFSAMDFAEKDEYITAAWKRVRIHLRHAGIRLARLPGGEAPEETPGETPEEAPEEAPEETPEEAPEETPAGEKAPGAPLAVLSEMDFFTPFPDETRRSLILGGRVSQIPRGETVFIRGDAEDSVFIVLEGIVDVRIRLENGERKDAGRRTIGASVGETAPLTGDVGPIDIVAVTGCRLMEIARADTPPFMGVDPGPAQPPGQTPAG